jgi:hypothetical protein
VVTHTRRAEPRPIGRTNPSSMDDCRVARLRARLQALRSEAAEVETELEAELEAVLAARAAGVSPWGSELLPLFLQQLLEHLQWDKDTCRAIRATCSTWCGVHDALLPQLELRGWMTGMAGKLGFFQSVETLRLHDADGFSGHLEELRSIPSLKSLQLPSRYAERAVDATALCTLTGLTYLRIDGVEGATGEWVLELGGFTMLTSLHLRHCTVTDAEVLAVGTLTALTSLRLFCCRNVTDVAVVALSELTGLTVLGLAGCNVTNVALGALGGLTGLTELDLGGCNVTDVGVGVLSGLTGLTTLSLSACNVTDVAMGMLSGYTALTMLNLGNCGDVTDVGVGALSGLNALSALILQGCNVTDVGVGRLSGLTALSTLYLGGCPNVTAAGKQALRTASPNLTIID